ncbi:MAG TPA: amidohydrolase family protein [Gaiellaceae bacterium]
MRIDAHVHFWGRPQLELYDWMTAEMEAIRRPFAPEELRPLLAAQGFDRAVLVQTHSSVEETRDFLALAAEVDVVAGVVGWVDLTSPKVPDTLAELRARPGGGYLVGIRHQVHDEPDPDWLRRDDVRRGLRTLEEAGLAYDVLVRTRELPAALDTARAFPGLRLVIDHLAKPPIASGELEPWAERMAPLAGLEHVSCKVSGLVTEADWERWTIGDLVGYVQRVVDWFGEERLLFGSDWPVCTLAASYGEVVRACELALGELTAPVREKVFGGNAARFYRLPLQG